MAAARHRHPVLAALAAVVTLGLVVPAVGPQPAVPVAPAPAVVAAHDAHERPQSSS